MRAGLLWLLFSACTATQKESDERKAIAGKWWMPYHIGREQWHGYDTKSAWFWQGQGKAVAPPQKMH